MKVIEKKSKLSGDGFWATHPSLKNRIENIKISDYPYESTDNFK
jgi:Zn-dependent protease with chaperone function